MVTRLMLSNGEFVYPEYLDAEGRRELRLKMEAEGLSMFCSCCTGNRLGYGISTDNRIFPLHKGYEHASWCSRAEKRQKTGAVVYDGNGKSTVSLAFNPLLFSDAREGEKKEPAGSGLGRGGTCAFGDGGDSEQKCFSLRQMVRHINRDTYSERVMLGKQPVLSEDYFRAAVLAHCRKVSVAGMKRNLRELSMQEDGCAFFYGRLSSCEESALSVFGSEGNVYRRLVPEAVMKLAREEFQKLYGVTAEACFARGLSVYASGFRHQRVSRAGKPYTCLGRVCLFLVTKQGLYAGSVAEKETLERLTGYARNHGGVFLFPDGEERNCFGIFRFPKEGKEGRICFGKPPEGTDGTVLCIRGVPEPQEVEAFAWRILHG